MNNSFQIATGHFEGPLEKLLDLIEERRLSISEISLAEVADSYLAYIEKLARLPLGETAQFVLIASTLLLIKSRALLPTLELSSDERESVEELERRLARLRLIRRCAKLLRGSWGAHPLSFARRAPSGETIFSPADASIEKIARAARKLIEILPKPERIAQAAVVPVLALEDVIDQLKKRLVGAFRARFSELTKSRNRHDVIVYFLAMLELVRSGSASVTQERLFEDITIESEGVAGAPKFGV
ncbi:MAG: segregation and condensation protein segregation and condensation protein [Candidatus Parcubacteria bacterium]|jgi:segregation and condensation protein A